MRGKNEGDWEGRGKVVQALNLTSSHRWAAENMLNVHLGVETELYAWWLFFNPLTHVETTFQQDRGTLDIWVVSLGHSNCIMKYMSACAVSTCLLKCTNT